MAKGDFAKQSYTGLPMWAKGVVAVAIIGGIGYLVYKLNKKIGDLKDSKDSKATVNDATKEYLDMKNQGKKLSYPESNYSSAINTIVKLLNNCDSFMSELQAVEEVIKIVKTPTDWTYLVSKFGNKDIDDCGWGKTNYDLPTLLKDQLDTGGAYIINQVNYKKKGYAFNSVDILADYLKTKGITL
jgi:hypothetical protein